LLFLRTLCLTANMHQPFGNGVRACIGRPFAWQEAILTVATLIQTFHFTKADPSYQLAIKTTLTIKPEHFYLKVKPRDDEFLERAGLVSSRPPSLEKKSGRNSVQKADQSDLKTLQILFGSNTGTCEAVARALATSAQEHGFKAEPQDMDSGVSTIDKSKPLIIVTASYEGQPPDNAGHFVEWLSCDPKELQGVQYAVFGLGNSTYHQCLILTP
jgi:cytochrome P450/NADPH-cytochrome P450 reductase